jgi:FtsZ-binding cell division protein ZapB
MRLGWRKGEAPEPRPKPASDTEKLEARMKEMADELADLRESLAEMTALAESAKAFEEKDEFKEMQVLRLELKSCKRRRDELMAENTALKRDVIRWRKKVIGK